MENRMRSPLVLASLLAMLAGTVALPAGAQPQDAAKERERRMLEQLRRAQAAQQQAVKERADLLAAQGELEAKLKEAAQSASRASGQAGSLRRDLDRTNAQLDGERAQSERLKAELAAAIAKARDNETALDAKVRALEQQNDEGLRRTTLRESQLRQLQATADERAAGLAACNSRADQLYRASNELLDRLQRRSAAESDVFLQWTRISGFEEAQRWRDRLDELKGGAPAEPAAR
jgi:chromosome segregation ATPase